MISDTRVLDNTGGVVYKASANLANLENFDATAHTTYKTAGIVVNNGGTFYESTSTVWSDVENTAFNAGTSPTAGLTANTSIVRLNTTGDYYKIKGDWGNSAVFPSASAVNSGTTVKDSGGIFYKLDQDFLGDTSSTRTPSGAGEWVKDATSSKYYRSKGTDDSSSILDTTKWDEFADFNAAVTAGLATDVDDNVKLNTPPAPSNDFWEKVTDDLTPSPTNTSGAWTTTLTNNSPTDLTNTHYWNPYADATDPSSNPSSNAIWENVTDKANLTAPPAGTANDFWADVTTAATTLTGGGASVSWWNEANSGLDNPNGTAATNVFWKDVSSDIFDFDNSGGSGMAATYWGASNVTAELTDPTAVGFSNWWSDETANINNLNDVGNSNLVDSYWDKVNLATSNTTYWTEYAHANSWTDFDHEYWQKVEPGMARLIGANGLNPAFTTPNLTEGIAREHQNPDPSGYDWSDYVRQQDMTIWKRVANIHGYRGGASTNGTGQTDGAERFGDHDTEETSGRPSGAIQAWNNTDYYEAGDVVKKGTGTGTKYYRMRRSGINIDPEDDDWASAGTGIVDPSKLNYVDDNNVYSPNSTDTSFQKWPGAASWDLIWDNSVNGAPTSDDNVYKLSYTDTDYWERIDTPPPISTSMATNAGDPWWELVQETTISSSQALGTVDLSAKIKDANFAGFDIKHFTHDGTLPIAQGGTGLIEDGAFFVGEGAGAVRISYNIENDSISDLMNRVSNSDAGVTMFYDPVGDRFVLRNDKAGAVGLTLHESPTDAGTFNPNPPFEWDTVSGNRGNGNVLQLMGLVDKTFQGDSNFGLTHDQAYPYYNDSAAYSKGDTVKLRIGNLTKWSYWRANENISAGEGEPSVDTPKWVQVVPGVGRAIMSELGTNSTIKLNDSNNLIYSNESVFGVDSHGYKGLNIDVSKASVGDIGTFTVSKDTSQAKAAIDKFVEEFNDAQDYIRSLTVVTNDGERVSSGKFSSNIEISRLGSQLRKVVFGDSIAHSRSELTTDGADLTIGSDTDVTNSSSWASLATELELKTDGTGNGYIVKIQIDSTNGNKTSYKIWEDQGSGTWGWTDNHKPTFSSFRISDIGLDFGIGSDRLQVRNSAALLEALENNSDMVKALFAESRVESTSESTDDDLNLTPKPKTLNNGDPNNPTATDITATGQVIANSAAFDLNSGTYRPYQGLSDGLDEFISAFLTGDEDSGYKGAYNTHIESIRSQNKRIDERIEDMERYLEQREKTLSDGFMRMEEMQSQLNTQLQTLQNSFKSK
jgi:flagellar capping protein FliD